MSITNSSFCKYYVNLDAPTIQTENKLNKRNAKLNIHNIFNVNGNNTSPNSKHNMINLCGFSFSFKMICTQKEEKSCYYAHMGIRSNDSFLVYFENLDSAGPVSRS